LDRGWAIKDLKWSSKVCPKQQVTPLSWYLLQLYQAYLDGHLPCAGGITDQPAKFMQAFAVIAERRALNAKRSKRGAKA